MLRGHEFDNHIRGVLPGFQVWLELLRYWVLIEKVQECLNFNHLALHVIFCQLLFILSANNIRYLTLISRLCKYFSSKASLSFWKRPFSAWKIGILENFASVLVPTVFRERGLKVRNYWHFKLFTEMNLSCLRPEGIKYLCIFWSLRTSFEIIDFDGKKVETRWHLSKLNQEDSKKYVCLNNRKDFSFI